MHCFVVVFLRHLVLRQSVRFFTQIFLELRSHGTLCLNFNLLLLIIALNQILVKMQLITNPGLSIFSLCLQLILLKVSPFLLLPLDQFLLPSLILSLFTLEHTCGFVVMIIFGLCSSMRRLAVDASDTLCLQGQIRSRFLKQFLV